MLLDLVYQRSQLAEEILDYLRNLVRQSSVLPNYYPAHLQVKGYTQFDNILRKIQVVEDRSLIRGWSAEEQERERRTGYGFGSLAYAPQAARPNNDVQTKPPSPPIFWDEAAAKRFPRAVILGDPGFGKSWLLRREANRLTQKALQMFENQTIQQDQLLMPILVRLSDINQTDDPLDAELIAIAGRGYSAAFREWLRQQLGRKRCVVLLDAWDEVPLEPSNNMEPIQYKPGYRQRLGQRLFQFAHQYPQVRLMITSRIIDYGESPIPDAQELELLAFDQPEIEAFVRVWFSDERADRFLEMLQNPAVRGLARIPLMLALMCRTAGTNEITFFSQRGKLYERCLYGLLYDWQRAGQKSSAEADAMLDLLGFLAERLFAAGYEQFSHGILRQQMIPFLQDLEPWHELYGQNPTVLITGIKDSGILVQTGDHHQADLLFLHRTLHEYLAAKSLAARANREGWKKIANLIDKKAWRPEWQQVIILLASQMDDPTPLLNMLSNPKPTRTNPFGDDLFRHRLALAALCLAETDQEWRASQKTLVTSIATNSVKIWKVIFASFIDETLLLLQHYEVVMTELGRINPVINVDHEIAYWRHESLLWGLVSVNAVESIPFLDWLSGLLHHENSHARKLAIDTIELIGNVAATEQIWERLIHMLLDNKSRWLVERALAAICRSIKPERVLDSLANLLQNADAGLRSTAVDIVGYMGEAVSAEIIIDCLRDDHRLVRSATLEILEKADDGLSSELISQELGSLLQDADKDVRRAAIKVLEKQGEEITEPLLSQLITLLLDNEVQRAARAAVEALGRGKAKERIFLQVSTLLQHQDWPDQRAVVEAVKLLGESIFSDEILFHLLKLLQHEEWLARRSATEAIRCIGISSATESVFKQLFPLLSDIDWEVRQTAAVTIGTLLKKRPIDHFLLQLANLLEHQDGAIRQVAAKAVGYIGKAAAKEPILTKLFNLLEDHEIEVWQEAAKAIGEVVDTNVPNPYLIRLADYLQGEDELMCQRVSETIGVIGSAAGSELILSQLAILLQDKNDGLRKTAVETVGKLGDTAATPQILTQMAILLQDENEGVRKSAIETVMQLRSAAATEPILKELLKLLDHEDESLQMATIRALPWLGSASGTEMILSRLSNLMLRHKDKNVRKAVIETLPELDGAASQQIMAQITEFLWDKELQNSAFRSLLLLIVTSRIELEPIWKQLVDFLADSKRAESSLTGNRMASRLIAQSGQRAISEPILEWLTEPFEFVSAPGELPDMLSLSGIALKSQAEVMRNMMNMGLRLCFSREKIWRGLRTRNRWRWLRPDEIESKYR